MPLHNIIYDDADFALWKREVQLELQEIFDRTRDQFIAGIVEICKEKSLSEEALQMLQAACDALDGTIIETSDLSGEYILVRDKDFITSQNRKEIVKWTDGLDELVKRGFVEVKGDKGEIFTVFKNGYDYVEQLK